MTTAISIGSPRRRASMVRRWMSIVQRGDVRAAQRHVARDLELAQQRLDQAHERRVVRRAGHVQVEARVELQQPLPVVRVVALQRQRALHGREVGVGGVHRGELGDAGLQHPPRLEHRRDLAIAHLAPLGEQRRRQQVGGHEHAAARAAPDGDHAGVDEGADGLAQGRAADAELLRELALARQAVAGVQVAGADQVHDLLHDGLERPARAHRLEGGKRPGTDGRHASHDISGRNRGSNGYTCFT